MIWIGALAGSYLAWRTLDRIGRITSIVAALIGFVVVYVLMVTVAFGTAWLVPLFCLLGVVTWWGASACWPLPSELAPTEVRGRAQGLGSGLQRLSIGVNVLLVPHMLAWVGFRATVLVAAGISVVFIPLALWGRRFEPSRKSLEVASGDQLLDGPDRRACRPRHGRRGGRQPLERRELGRGSPAPRAPGLGAIGAWRVGGLALRWLSVSSATWLIASAIAPRTSALAPSSPSTTG